MILSCTGEQDKCTFFYINPQILKVYFYQMLIKNSFHSIHGIHNIQCEWNVKKIVHDENVFDFFRYRASFWNTSLNMREPQ